MGSETNTSCFSPSSSFESLLSHPDIESGVSFPKYPSPFPHSGNKMVGPSPRSPRFSSLPDDGGDGAHHFLDSCHLCKRPLGGGRDIYMYRGDTPFCSEECRQEQIEMDEASERRSVMAQKQKAKNSKSPSKSEKIEVRVSGTVVAG